MVIRKVESLVSELKGQRERTRKADVALHNSIVEFVKTQFDGRVDEYIKGSASIGDAIASLAGAGIVFLLSPFKICCCSWICFAIKLFAAAGTGAFL